MTITEPFHTSPTPRKEPGLLPAVGRAADGISTVGSRFLDTVTTNEALHEGTAKGFEMGGKIMGYAGNRIVRDIATDIALGKIGKVVGKTPRIGAALQTGVGLVDQNRKFYDLYDEFNNLPEDARKIGKDLSRIGQSSRKRRTS